MQDESKNEKKNARRQAREQVFGLLYETEFHEGETAEQILERAAEDREFDANDPYLRGTYLGVVEHMEEIDTLIGRYAKGWKTKRLSRVSRAVLRLGTYELCFSRRVPSVVAINEAVELSKRFDDPRARAFVNGVLNAVKDAVADGTAADAPAVESAVSEPEETPAADEKRAAAAEQAEAE
jgi:transcription antitermination protein NusB